MYETETLAPNSPDFVPNEALVAEAKALLADIEAYETQQPSGEITPGVDTPSRASTLVVVGLLGLGLFLLTTKSK